MFTFEQSTGVLTDQNGCHVGTGYAGHGEGLLAPSMQDVEGVGPLPQGMYTIGEPYTNPHTGRVTMNLDPVAGNQMFGRSLFRIHGDNAQANHTASDGCIVMSLGVRLAVAKAIGFEVDLADLSVTRVPATSDNLLQVIA